jgi:hypothetical protein
LQPDSRSELRSAQGSSHDYLLPPNQSQSVPEGEQSVGKAAQEVGGTEFATEDKRLEKVPSLNEPVTSEIASTKDSSSVSSATSRTENPIITASDRRVAMSGQFAAPPISLQFTLPNASVGLEYFHRILPTTSVLGFSVVKLVAGEDFGLRYEASTGSLVGTPTKAGEFDLDVHFSHSNGVGEPSRTRLIVNPDPKTLWKVLPSDKEDPYWKPDEEQQFVQGLGGWSLVAGSKRGRSHAQKGSFRDDDFFLCSQQESGWQIAIVSDGAGSSRFSRRGSSILCKEGGSALEQRLSGETGAKLSEAVQAWHATGLSLREGNAMTQVKRQLFYSLGYAAHFGLTRILEECKSRPELGGLVKDYSSTMLIGIVKRFPVGVFCAGFNIGDGAIGVVQRDGTPQLLCEPDGGDFSGQTRFVAKETVTAEELLKRIKFSLVPNFAGLYLMTDGISDPYFQTDKGLEMPERWSKLLEDIEMQAVLSQRDADVGKRLLAWLDFWSKGEHDDRTLAAIF